MKQWTDKLIGYDGWPWGTIPVRISGSAVYSASDLGWTSSDNGVPIYIGDTSFENAPQCPQNCGRFFHTDKNYMYPNCSGGAANHYDFSSWHSQSMNGMGFGSDWGQRTISTSTLNQCSSIPHIILHETGHGFFLPDFYDFSVPGGNPSCVMNAGSATTVTAYDEWTLKRVYSELKRMPNRFPVVKTVLPAQQSRITNLFGVFSEKGRIALHRLSGSASGEIIISVYDFAGKVVLLQTAVPATATLMMQPLNPGMYVVKIKGKSFSEVHQVNIAR